MNKGDIQLLVRDEVQGIFDHFAQCFKSRIILFAPDGTEVRVGLNQPNSEYCRCIHQLHGEEPCLALDDVKRQEAAAKREMVSYRCHAGLIEAIKPVYFQERLLGFVAIGQFRSGAEIPEDIEREWRIRVGSDHIAQCFAGLSCISEDSVSAVLGLFTTVVDYIVTQQMIGLGGNRDLTTILTYMQKHLHQDIALDDVAGLIGKSRSTVSHLFKSHTGKSFKRTLVEMKLSEAERLLLTDSSLSIREAASRVGYSDALYFSRLFKKVRGIAPSSVR